MRIFRKIPCVAALAALAMAVFTPASRADFEVQILAGTEGVTYHLKAGGLSTSDPVGGATAGSITQLSNGSYRILDAVVGGFSLSTNVTRSNSPGNQEFAIISISDSDIWNNGQNTLITIIVGDTGFLAPSGAMGILKNTVAAQAGAPFTGTNNTVKLQSWLDTTNNQFGMGQPGGAGLVNGPHVIPGDTTSRSWDESTPVTPFPTPYSLTQIATIQLNPGNNLVNASFTTTLATPAPSGLLLAVTGVPILGIGAWLRRRIVRA